MKKSTASKPESFRELDFPDLPSAQTLFGDLNKNLHTVELATGVTLHTRGQQLQISGQDHAVALVASLFEQLYQRQTRS